MINTGLNLTPLLPELFLVFIGMGLLMVGVLRGDRSTPVIIWASAIGIGLSAALLMKLGWQDDAIILGGMFRFDYFTGLMQLVIAAGLVLALLLSLDYLPQEKMERFEYPVLVLFAGIGMMLMVAASNLLALYMALELQSLSLYVLASFLRNSERSAEAGVKYFVLGAISSGMILFGTSMIYGCSGSLDYGTITVSLMTMKDMPVGITFGLVFLMAGLAFKVSAAPFHMWTPDVYQGAPGSVTALFAIVPKVAAMGLIARLLTGPFAPAYDEWVQIVWFLSAASMVVGAFAAIAQENIKRLMAYSSIGNMGYALIGIAVGTAEGASALIIYMLIYMIMTAGVFGVILSMRRKGIAAENISDLSGLSQTSPGLAYAMAILMFSMSGIPPMAGFFGKLMIFQSAVNEGFYALAVLGVLSSVVAAYYYLRVIKVMFFDTAAAPLDSGLPFARRLVLMASIFFVMAFVVRPSFIVERTQAAAASLFPG